MKISILLPTRDRLLLLRHAVDSVLRLDDEDWEVIVSDNESSEDVEGYVAGLGDERVIYTRTPRLLPVAENWENALRHSRGEYVVMLGDDDALLGDYFSRTRELVQRFDAPDVIYHGALVYAYPDVLPEAPEGYLRSESYAEFLRGATQPFVLEPDRARRLVRGSMNFSLRYGFNMQFATIKRSFIDAQSHDGPFFRSPFPDYYAMNLSFARARSIVVEPRPLVVIGVSPRSYGFFHNNAREAEGRQFLEGDGDDRDRRRLLPGSNINDGWLGAMEDLSRELGDARLVPNYRRYRRLQIAYVYEGHRLRHTISPEQFAQLQRRISRRERLFYDAVFGALAALQRWLPAGRKQLVSVGLIFAQGQFPGWAPGLDPEHYKDIVDVAERVEPSRYPERWGTPTYPRLRAVLRAGLGWRVP